MIMKRFVTPTGVLVYHNGMHHREGVLPWVFVHGMWGFPLMFYVWMRLLKMFEIEAYSVCLPGHNKKDRVNGKSIQDYVMAVNSAIADIGECTLVGWSAGGLISQLVAEKNPLVRKLVLVASAAPQGVFIGWRPFLKMGRPSYLWPVISGDELVLSASDTEELMFNVGFDRHEFSSLLKHLVPESGRVAREITVGVRVGEVKCPMLIIAAGNDNITGTVQESLRKKYSHAKFISFPGASHMMMLQKGVREEVLDEILRWAGLHQEILPKAA